MADRKPLIVSSAGEVGELPAGDGIFGLGGPGIALGAGDNLDSLTVSGLYVNGLAGNTTGNNYPLSSSGSLLNSYSSSVQGFQMYVSYSGTGSTVQRMFFRAKGSSGVFSAWSEITNLASLNELIDDRVAALLQQGSGVTITYNDAANTLTIVSAAVPAGASGEIQYNLAGALGAATEAEIEGGQLRLTIPASPATPATGGVKLFARQDAGKAIPAFMGEDAVLQDLQIGLARSSPVIWKAQFSSAALSALGGVVPTPVGTATPVSPAVTNLFTRTPKLEYLVVVAATTAVSGFRSTVTLVTVGASTAGLGGFHFVGRWGPATGVATTTSRAFFGLANVTSAPTDVEPSTTISCVAMGWDAADTNIQMMSNDATGVCTKVDLGASFPVPTTDRTDLYELAMYSPKGTTQSVSWQVTNLRTGAVASGTITTDLPANTSLQAPRGWISVGGTSSIIGLGLVSLYLDSLL